jgi:hypothetical protein
MKLWRQLHATKLSRPTSHVSWLNCEKKWTDVSTTGFFFVIMELIS